MEKNKFTFRSIPIATIVNDINIKMLNLRPNYQRDYIWKNDFKDELILSIFKNYPIGNIIISNSATSISEVLDGQQRLTTIQQFLNGKYIIKNKKNIEKIKVVLDDLFKRYEKYDIFDENSKKILSKNLIKFADLPNVVQENFKSYNLNVTELNSFTTDEIVEYFKFVQNQETLKAGEIINSLSVDNFDLNQLIKMINDKSTFLELMNYKAKRLEFDKYFINFVGLLNEKIALNETESKIISFASKFNFEMVIEPINLLINNINLLVNLYLKNEISQVHKTNARFLKLLLSFLCFYDLKNININLLLETLININKNSSDLKITKEITFIQSRNRNLKDVQKAAENIFNYYNILVTKVD